MTTIAIIGAGYSGISVLHQLCKLGSDAHVLLFEKRDQLAQGAAYSTPDPHHLLNVAAHSMSALHDEPDHFVNWLKANHFEDFTPHDDVEGQYVPRMIYGRYIASLLDEVLKDESKTLTLDIIQEPVVDIEEGFTVKTADKDYAVDQVVLANGNFAPQCICRDLLTLPEGKYIHNPWQYNAIQHIEPDQDVMILGTGLTMVDIVVTLQAKGHRGQITAVSRRGLLPLAHKVHEKIPSFIDEQNLPTTASALMRLVHQVGKQLVKEGADWRSVIDSLRPYNAKLWDALPMVEKHRFMRHVRPYWDVMRHRIAPEIAAILDAKRADGSLVVQGGRVRAFEMQGEKVICEFKPRGQAESQSIQTDVVINAVGPSGNIAKIGDELLSNLLAKGLLSQDDSQLGPIVFDKNKSVDQSSIKCFLHGPMTKAKYWEMIAVPDIRHQSFALAKELMEQA